MDALKLKTVWLDYLEGRLSTEAIQEVEGYLETCPEGEIPAIVEAEFAALLREKLPQEAAPAELRDRILRQIQADPLHTHAAQAQVTQIRASQAPRSSSSTAASLDAPWYQRWMGNAWAPRVAMAAVLLLAVLIPLRTILGPPSLAADMVERHDCHAPTYGEAMPTCCEAVHWGTGDVIPKHANRAKVPNLSDQGLELVASSRCHYKGTLVNILGYKNRQGLIYSLYISDQFTDKYRKLKQKQVKNGIMQASYVADDDDITMWERNSVVYFWIGPKESPDYDTVLAGLQSR